MSYLTKTPEQIYEVYFKLVSTPLLSDDSDKEPVKFENSVSPDAGNKAKGNISYWIYKGSQYAVTGLYSDEECKLLILEDFDKERQYFEKLRTKFYESSDIEEYSRPRIPEKIRVEVWRRDGGKCARCGSREKLEYDHIVPISRGGSNTARNIELLCEKCNRSKSNNVI